MTNRTICIEREYGSNGKKIAEWLAKSSGLPCYDKGALKRVAEEKNLAVFDKNAPEDEEEREQAAYREAIKYLADKESCIFVGTCASAVLQGRPKNVNIFIRADLETKILWAMASEKLERGAAEAMIAEMDEKREDARKSHVVTENGEPVVYDLTVYSSRFGIEGTAEIIKKSLTRL